MADDEGMPGERLEEPGSPGGDWADHGVEGAVNSGVGASVDTASPTAADESEGRTGESERQASAGDDAAVRAAGRAAAEGAGGGLTPAGMVDREVGRR